MSSIITILIITIVHSYNVRSYRKYASECNTLLGLGGTATNIGSGCLVAGILLVCVAAADVSNAYRL